MSRVIVPSSSLSEGTAVSFEALVAGERRSCVALRTAAGLSAFVNLCAHRRQPVVVDDRPFDEAGRLECRAHGAFYDPVTGLCVEGPCRGARLQAVAVRDEAGQVVVDDDDLVDDSVYGDLGEEG
jgi:nitrite reductase/ring-hydroxylating ferredoxin subunit